MLSLLSGADAPEFPEDPAGSDVLEMLEMLEVLEVFEVFEVFEVSFPEQPANVVIQRTAANTLENIFLIFMSSIPFFISKMRLGEPQTQQNKAEI